MVNFVEETGDFLCTRELGKKYLVEADKIPIEIEYLYGKTVGILFLDVVEPPPLYLKEAYRQIRRTHGHVFEIVLVPLGMPGGKWKIYCDQFDAQIVDMPWLAVPYSQPEWRMRLAETYKKTMRERDLAIFDEKGHLIWEFALRRIKDYGPALYPFSDARAREMENKWIVKSKTLEWLLASTGRDYLIANDGHTKVPISQLKGNVIGLYTHRRHERKLWGDCRPKKYLFDFLSKGSFPRFKIFKIVFITDDETWFLRFSKQLPDNWLALPFEDDKIGAKSSLMSAGAGGSFPIIGADGDLFLHGAAVIQAYGFDAFPFTLHGAVIAEIKRLEEFNFNKFLDDLGVDRLLRKHGDTASLSLDEFQSIYLMKDLVIYINGPSSKEMDSHLVQLAELYYENPSVIVILLSEGQDYTSFARYFKVMPFPWFVLPYQYPGWYENRFEKMGVIFPGPGHVITFKSGGKLHCVGKLPSFGCSFPCVGKLPSFGCSFPYITRRDFVKTVTCYLRYQKHWD